MSLVEDLLGGEQKQSGSSLVDDMLSEVPNIPLEPVEQNPNEPSTMQDVINSARAGMNESPTGAVIYGEQEPYNPSTTAGKVTKTIANLGSTIPYYMAGAELGALTSPALSAYFGGAPEAVAPLAATGGAFVLPKVVEELAKQFHSGKLSYDNLAMAVGEELAKSIVFHKAGEVGGKLFRPLGKLAESAGRLGLEGTSLAFLATPGKMPTGEDVLSSVATLAALGIAGVTGAKLKSKVFKLAVKGVDVNKFTDLIKSGAIDEKTAKNILNGKTPKTLGSIWERMPEGILRENAKQGVKEAQAEVERRTKEKAKELTPQEGEKPLERAAKSGKKTKNGKYLKRIAKYKEVLGKKKYYEVLNSLGLEKSNQVTLATHQSMVITALRSEAEKINPEPKVAPTSIPTPEPKPVEAKPMETSGEKIPKGGNKTPSGERIPTVKQEVKIKETGQTVTIEKDAREVLDEVKAKRDKYESFMKDKFEIFKKCMGW